VTAAGVVGRAALIDVLRNPKLANVYLVATFTVAAHFGAFTFIEPYLRQIPSIAPGEIAPLLLSFGMAGLFANVLTGLFIDRFMRPVIILSLLLMCLAFVGLALPQPRFGSSGILIFLPTWGAAIAALFIGLQSWVLRAGGTAAVPASALYTTIFNSAIGIGAMLEGLVLSATGLSGVMAAAGCAVALATLIALNCRSGDAA
jgi:predicted MFS family arabinose efflux permease